MNVSTARGFREWDRFDYLLTIAAVALVIYGLILIYSGTLRSYDGPFASLSNLTVSSTFSWKNSLTLST